MKPTCLAALACSTLLASLSAPAATDSLIGQGLAALDPPLFGLGGVGVPDIGPERVVIGDGVDFRMVHYGVANAWAIDVDFGADTLTFTLNDAIVRSTGGIGGSWGVLTFYHPTGFVTQALEPTLYGISLLSNVGWRGSMLTNIGTTPDTISIDMSSWAAERVCGPLPPCEAPRLVYRIDLAPVPELPAVLLLASGLFSLRLLRRRTPL